MKKILILCLSFLVFNTALAQRVPILEMYHGAECPHCHHQKDWLPILMEMYPGIEIREYEVWHNPENKALLQKRLNELKKESNAVPTNIIGDEVIVGFKKEKIIEIMKEEYGAPAKTETQILEERKANTLWGKIVSFFKNLFK